VKLGTLGKVECLLHKSVVDLIAGVKMECRARFGSVED
jgi:hypothetical protein